MSCGRFLVPSDVFTAEKQGFLRFRQVWQSISFPTLFIMILVDFWPLLAHMFEFWGHWFSVWFSIMFLAIYCPNMDPKMGPKTHPEISQNASRTRNALWTSLGHPVGHFGSISVACGNSSARGPREESVRTKKKFKTARKFQNVTKSIQNGAKGG